MEEQAMFVRDGDAFVGTTLTQGGWDRRHMNGAAVLALLGHCLDDVPSLVPMMLTRFTVDLARPMPIGEPLRVVPTVVREGKKLQVVQLRVVVGDVDHAWATALRLRQADLSGVPGIPHSTTTTPSSHALLAPRADVVRRRAPRSTQWSTLFPYATLRRSVRDGHGYGYWARLDTPVVAGDAPRATARITFAFDCANLVGVEQPMTTVTMINPDVTAHVLRPPVDEWIAITGDTLVTPAVGRSMTIASFSDRDGLFAQASLSQLVQPQPAD
jgi:hypothetical protein